MALLEEKVDCFYVYVKELILVHHDTPRADNRQRANLFGHMRFQRCELG